MEEIKEKDNHIKKLNADLVVGRKANAALYRAIEDSDQKYEVLTQNYSELEILHKNIT